MDLLYINWCCILFGCAQTKKSDQLQTSDTISPVSQISTLQVWWNLISVQNRRAVPVPQVLRLIKELGCAIVLQTLLFDWQLVTHRFCTVSRSRKFYSMSINSHWVLIRISVWLTCRCQDVTQSGKNRTEELNSYTCANITKLTNQKWESHVVRNDKIKKRDKRCKARWMVWLISWFTTLGSVCSSSRSEKSEKSHLWCPLKSPLLLLHPDNLLFSPLERSSQRSYLRFGHKALYS